MHASDLHNAKAAFLLPPELLYLDTAAHGPRLRAVQSAAQAALDAGATPWTTCWDEWEAQVERVRALASQLFDANGDAVALVPSAAYGLSIAARNLPLTRDEAVLVLADAFPSNLLPWQQRCREVGARMHGVTRGDDATAAVLAALDGDAAVRIVSLPQVHWHDGSRLDLDAISAAVHARGAALVLDLSQSLGAMPAQIARWRPAFAVSVGYKWLLGPHGLCYFWADSHWRAHGVPIEQHWAAYEARADWSFRADGANDYRPGARRFDAGEITDVQRLAMAEAGLTQVLEWGVDAIAHRLGGWTAALREALADDGFDAPAQPGPHITGLRPRSVEPSVCMQALRAAGIVCTARHGVLRIAPHLHVDADDIDRVARVLRAAG
ncbi:aminotransferase class V-fold PLP-dependent enzyme [Lysobacter korlensis]|uniref:Aminotransferase class V-fold PLP-dependent enzyme n=1 Tax=Lysobacter korlensis TaxID=553636 RepID=A0ABV6RHE6_9GAMM